MLSVRDEYRKLRKRHAKIRKWIVAIVLSNDEVREKETIWEGGLRPCLR
jgi:hypothetical protein